MKNLLNKELKLATSPLAWFFLLFSFMTFLPGYPILMGAFFVCMGIFQSFRQAREFNDTLYTVLLPIRKADAVAARFLSVIFFQIVGLALMAVFTVIRMTMLSTAAAYVTNPLMNATPVFLAFVLLIYAGFNLVFVKGFYKTAFNIGKPFIGFTVVTLILVGIAEVIIHVPALEFLHAPAGEKMPVQLGILAAAAVLYIIVTAASEKASERQFEMIDL